MYVCILCAHQQFEHFTVACSFANTHSLKYGCACACDSVRIINFPTFCTSPNVHFNFGHGITFNVTELVHQPSIYSTNPAIVALAVNDADNAQAAKGNAGRIAHERPSTRRAGDIYRDFGVDSLATISSLLSRHSPALPRVAFMNGGGAGWGDEGENQFRSAAKTSTQQNFAQQRLWQCKRCCYYCDFAHCAQRENNIQGNYK